MKQRLITAAVGIALLLGLLFFFETPIYNLAMSILSAVAVYELLLATKYIQNKVLTVASILFAAAVPFLRMSIIRGYSILFLLLFLLILFGVLLFGHEKVRLEQIGLIFFVSIVFPFALTSFVYIRDQFGLYQGLYYTLLIYACAWGADAGAYFIGRFFGKKKLAPKISPNKTVEGFWGGFLGSALLIGLVTLAFHLCLPEMQLTLSGILALIGAWIGGTLLSVFGDLSASIMKRQCSIKDFGNIIPGHGGVVDRFDSIFFVAPFFYALLQFVQI